MDTLLDAAERALTIRRGRQELEGAAERSRQLVARLRNQLASPCEPQRDDLLGQLRNERAANEAKQAELRNEREANEAKQAELRNEVAAREAKLESAMKSHEKLQARCSILCARLRPSESSYVRRQLEEQLSAVHPRRLRLDRLP